MSTAENLSPAAKLAISILLLAAVAFCLFWGGVIWTALHFIVKFW